MMYSFKCDMTMSDVNVKHKVTDTDGFFYTSLLE